MMTSTASLLMVLGLVGGASTTVSASTCASQDDQEFTLPQVTVVDGLLKVNGLIDGWKIEGIASESGQDISVLIDRQGDLAHIEYGDLPAKEPIRVELRFEHADGATTLHRTAWMEWSVPLTAALQRGRTLTIDDRALSFCEVQAGVYRLGIPRERWESGAHSASYLQTKQHEIASFETTDGTLPVQLETRFWIAQHEVDVGLWLRYAKAAGIDPSPWAEENTDHPVRRITCDQAQQFCRWLETTWASQGYTAFALRLPRELEWEIAARGPGTGPLPGPDGESSIVRPDIASIGTTKEDRSPFGVLDLGGNAAEWTCSRYRNDWPQFLLERAGESGVLTYDVRQPPAELALAERDQGERVAVRGGASHYHPNTAAFDVSARRSSFRDRATSFTSFRFVVIPE